VVSSTTPQFRFPERLHQRHENASGDAVILLDGDLQDPPELIEAFTKKWREGYQVVYGNRVKREASASMQFFYKAFYRVFQKVAYVPIPLDAGDFSLLDAAWWMR